MKYRINRLFHRKIMIALQKRFKLYNVVVCNDCFLLSRVGMGEGDNMGAMVYKDCIIFNVIPPEERKDVRKFFYNRVWKYLKV